MMGWELALFSRLEEPTLGEILEAEKKLLVFARWLSRDYASATTIQYIGEVKKAHVKWLGAPLEAMKVVFFRLPMLYRMLKERGQARRGKRRHGSSAVLIKSETRMVRARARVASAQAW